ncbi:MULTISPECIES: hypothetical protein [Microbacterium]|uniref:Uncharacterized protein n=1 Tax=Microbacterium oxydans TaxID=82380 RepID=A0A3S9WFZ6_9MICO|nr:MULTISPECIES: hypothetical protein [Microbacterium]AZS38981.1 hypothetical protein CVS54_00278 [Microbacterium oxydans]
MAERVRGTSRERATVAALVIVGVALPVIANLQLFQDVVWIFWLTSFTLIATALALLVRATVRERRRSSSS